MLLKHKEPQVNFPTACSIKFLEVGNKTTTSKTKPEENYSVLFIMTQNLKVGTAPYTFKGGKKKTNYVSSLLQQYVLTPRLIVAN